MCRDVDKPPPLCTKYDKYDSQYPGQKSARGTSEHVVAAADSAGVAVPAAFAGGFVAAADWGGGADPIKIIKSQSKQ